MPKRNKELLAELKHYQKDGVDLTLEEKKSDPKEIAKAQSVCEEGSYMRDYVWNENGELKGINFRFIKHNR